MPKIRVGLWTPWADVVCAKCHGPLYWTRPNAPIKDFKPGYLSREELKKAKDDYCGVAKCDKCGQMLVVRSDVAKLQSVRRALNEVEGLVATMAQTGGMCCGLEVSVEGKECFAMVTMSEEEGYRYLASIAKDEETWVEHWDLCEFVEAKNRMEVVEFYKSKI